MARFTYELAGQQAQVEVPDDLAAFYRAQPGYVEVIDEEKAAELTGAALDQAARELAGITNPKNTPAREKREAIVTATAPDTEEK